MELTKEEKLRKIRDQILEKYRPEIENERMIFEFQELRRELRKLIPERVNQIKVDNLLVKFPELINIDWQEAKKYINFKPEITVAPAKVIIPEKTKIDWENMPPQKEIIIPKTDFVSPLKVFANRIIKGIAETLSRLELWLAEPDKITISKNEMIEYYGKKKVIYWLRYNDIGELTEVVRNES